MKKTIFLAAIACVALAGCTKNEKIADNDRDVAIGFSPLTSAQTKAVSVFGEMGAAYDSQESFKAYSIWSAADYAAGAGTEFFPAAGVDCSYDGSIAAWKPAQTYYWPKNGKLTFEALSPADATGTISHSWATGFTITDFTVADAIKDQYDLLYSDRVFNKVRSDFDNNTPYDDEDDATYIYNGVNLLFRHALSSIVFKVKTKADYSANATITLTGITINNADSKGTFSENVTDAAAASYVAPTPSWDNVYATADEKDYSIFSGSQVVNSGTAQAVSPLVGSATNIILLPQALEHTSTSKDVTVTVTYTVAQNGGDAIPQTAVIKLKDLTASSTAITAWEINKRYTYTIVFGLEEIYFDPAVADWTDVTMDEYEIKESDI